MPDEGLAARIGGQLAALRAEIGKALVGQTELVDGALCALVAGGHCLIEGAPGLGKTLLARTLSRALALQFGRIQFTPDLMPADITGAQILEEKGGGKYDLVFRPGPVFTQLLLADEINRATPKTQSALLEAMQEATVTAGGETRALPAPFLVLATQNPIEMEGTYPLPEAQLDRFLLKLRVAPPELPELREIIRRGSIAQEPQISPVASAANILHWQQAAHAVILPESVVDYAARLALATAPGSAYAGAKAAEFARFGASPRGALALARAAQARALLEGRGHTSFADVRAMASPCLRHRIILNFSGDAAGIDPDTIIADAIDHTPESIRA